MTLKATLPTRFLQRCRTFCVGPNDLNAPNHGGHCILKVQSAVPLLALAVVDGWGPQEKNLACMHSSMDKVRCSFGVVAARELAVVASTAVVVVAAGVEEHAAEVHRFAAVGANLDGSVLEMVPRHIYDLPAVDTTEEVRSVAGFDCSMPRLDLPWQASEEAVP